MSLCSCLESDYTDKYWKKMTELQFLEVLQGLQYFSLKSCSINLKPHTCALASIKWENNVNCFKKYQYIMFHPHFISVSPSFTCVLGLWWTLDSMIDISSIAFLVSSPWPWKERLIEPFYWKWGLLAFSNWIVICLL